MSNIIEIRFPEDQQEGTEATVTRWIVAEGDLVAAHDPVVEIETDKVVVEIAAPEAGRIDSIKIQLDEEANPGDVLCTLNTGKQADAEPHTQAQSAKTETHTDSQVRLIEPETLGQRAQSISCH